MSEIRLHPDTRVKSSMKKNRIKNATHSSEPEKDVTAFVFLFILILSLLLLYSLTDHNNLIEFSNQISLTDITNIILLVFGAFLLQNTLFIIAGTISAIIVNFKFDEIVIGRGPIIFAGKVRTVSYLVKLIPVSAYFKLNSATPTQGGNKSGYTFPQPVRNLAVSLSTILIPSFIGFALCGAHILEVLSHICLYFYELVWRIGEPILTTDIHALIANKGYAVATGWVILTVSLINALPVPTFAGWNIIMYATSLIHRPAANAMNSSQSYVIGACIVLIFGWGTIIHFLYEVIMVTLHAP